MLSFHWPIERSLSGLALIGVMAACLSGCFATTYDVTGANGAETRLSGPRPDEKIIRHVSEEVGEHHYFFGLIADNERLDVRESLSVNDDENLVNVQIKSLFSGIDCLIIIGTGIISAGIVPAIWMPRTTIVSADVTEPSKSEGTSSSKLSNGESDLIWKALKDKYSFKDAAAACSKKGYQIPSLALLKTWRKALQRSGDYWTGDENNGEGWYYALGDGSEYLASKDRALSVLCFKSTIAPL